MVGPGFHNVIETFLLHSGLNCKPKANPFALGLLLFPQFAVPNTVCVEKVSFSQLTATCELHDFFSVFEMAQLDRSEVSQCETALNFRGKNMKSFGKYN